MKRYSEDKFDFKSQLTPNEIFDLLNKSTLKRNNLFMELTNKDFIGRVSPESFSVIDSSFPIPFGAACILNGTINPDSTISLTTTLHKIFRITFLVWLIFISIMFLVFWIIGPANVGGLIAFLIGMPIISLLFRLFLHGMYVLARNNALNKLKNLLKLTD